MRLFVVGENQIDRGGSDDEVKKRKCKVRFSDVVKYGSKKRQDCLCNVCIMDK